MNRRLRALKEKLANAVRMDMPEQLDYNPEEEDRYGKMDLPSEDVHEYQSSVEPDFCKAEEIMLEKEALDPFFAAYLNTVGYRYKSLNSKKMRSRLFRMVCANEADRERLVESLLEEDIKFDGETLSAKHTSLNATEEECFTNGARIRVLLNNHLITPLYFHFRNVDMTTDDLAWLLTQCPSADITFHNCTIEQTTNKSVWQQEKPRSTSGYEGEATLIVSFLGTFLTRDDIDNIVVYHRPKKLDYFFLRWKGSRIASEVHITYPKKSHRKKKHLVREASPTQSANTTTPEPQTANRRDNSV